MFYYLAELLTPHFTVFNVVSYQTFRAVMSLLTALVFTLLIGPKTIAELRKFHLELESCATAGRRPTSRRTAPRPWAA